MCRYFWLEDYDEGCLMGNELSFMLGWGMFLNYGDKFVWFKDVCLGIREV